MSGGAHPCTRRDNWRALAACPAAPPTPPVHPNLRTPSSAPPRKRPSPRSWPASPSPSPPCRRFPSSRPSSPAFASSSPCTRLAEDFLLPGLRRRLLPRLHHAHARDGELPGLLQL